MTHLSQAFDMLMRGVQNDSLFKIAHAVSFFDPLWCDDEFYEEDPLANALHICRRAFPDLYVESLQALRNSRDYAYVESIICDGITALGIPLDHIEYMGWGIPLPAYGVELDDPDFVLNFPELAPILACFGVEMGEPDDAHRLETLCPLLAQSLLKKSENWRKVAVLLLWLINQTECTLTDLHYEILSEFEPLQWEYDLDLAIHLIQDADDIMGKVHDGIHFLNTHDTALQTLSDNIERLTNALKKGEEHASKFKLCWAE